MTAHAWYRGWVVRPAAVALLAAFIVGLTALTGIDRGMDRKVAYGPLSDQRAISIALSDSVYGLNLGYVGLRSVQDKLLEIWNRGAKDPEDPILIENSSNADLVNEAIRAAASLGPQKVGYLSDRSLMTTELDDMGDVDFYKLAFRLFGLQIQSYYYLFFAVLALSVVVFILTFHDDVYALVAMLCTLCAFYVALYLNDVFSISAPTFPGYRHGGTLALIPLWHFIFLMSRRRSVGVILGAVVQLAIMIFAYRIRGSVGWMFILLFAMAGATALMHWLRLARVDRSWSALVRATAPWPVLLLVCGITANYGYTVFTLHPIYFTDDVLPYDGPWHCAYLGFEAAPGLLTPRGKAAMAYGSGDEFAAYGEYDYLDRTHFIPWDGSKQMPADAMSAWTGSDKARLKDDIMRRVVLEAIVRHPVEALVLYAYTKPVAIVRVVKSAFLGAGGKRWLWTITAGGLVGAILLLLFDRIFDPARLARIVLTSGAVTLFSTLPNLWAYAELHVMGDVILTLAAFIVLLLSAVFYFAISMAAAQLKIGRSPVVPNLNRLGETVRS